MRIPLPSVSALLLCCAAADGTGAPGAPPAKLAFELIARASYVEDAPVVVTFRLHGLPNAGLLVLRWNTPLEGLRGRLFRVRRGEVEIPYAGPMVKRGDPARSDYLELPAGGTLSADVDLAAGYDFGVPGDYTVELLGALLDVAPAGAPLPRSRAQFQRAVLDGKPVVVRRLAKP